jgi:hypothetical protein
VLASTAPGLDVSAHVRGVSLSLLDLVGLGASSAMTVAGAARAVANLRVLAPREPVPHYTPAP